VTKIDLREYLATQAQERYPAFIIHAPAMSHKTMLARRMRDVLGAYLLDLQAYFLKHPDLAETIDLFRPRDLEKLLLNLELPQNAVVVDNMDFLLNTWTNKLLREFAGMVELRLKSPDTTNKTFVFVVQTDPVLLEHELQNSRGQPRILPRETFYAL
jgi:hypothetical protein